MSNHPSKYKHGNSRYLDFLDYLFIKNQESAVPSQREQFYNIAQQFWHELQIKCDNEGLEFTFESMRLNTPYSRKGTGKE